MIDKNPLLQYVCDSQGHVTTEDILRLIEEAKQRGDHGRVRLLVVALNRLVKAQLCGDSEPKLQAS